MLSAISATRFAMRLAMMAYAEVTPFAWSPATEAALFAAGTALCAGLANADFLRAGLPAIPGFLAAKPLALFVGTPFTLDAIAAGRGFVTDEDQGRVCGMRVYVADSEFLVLQYVVEKDAWVAGVDV